MKDVISYLTENLTSNIMAHLFKLIPASNQSVDPSEEEGVVARIIHHGCLVSIPSEAAKAMQALGVTIVQSTKDDAILVLMKTAIVKAVRDLSPTIFYDTLEAASQACLSILKDKKLQGTLSVLLPSSVPPSAVAAAADLTENEVLSSLANRLLPQVQNQVQKNLVSIIQRPEGSVQAVIKAMAAVRLESVLEEVEADKITPVLTSDPSISGSYSSNLEDLMIRMASESPLPKASLSLQLEALASEVRGEDDLSDEGRHIALRLYSLTSGTPPLELSAMESALCHLLKSPITGPGPIAGPGRSRRVLDLIAWTGTHFFAHHAERVLANESRCMSSWMGERSHAASCPLMTLLPSRLIAFACESENIEMMATVRRMLQKISFSTISQI